MDKMIAYVEMRVRLTKDAYERSHSIQWMRRHQEAMVILEEAKRIERRLCRATIKSSQKTLSAAQGTTDV